jgi:hypothetical protein
MPKVVQPKISHYPCDGHLETLQQPVAMQFLVGVPFLIPEVVLSAVRPNRKQNGPHTANIKIQKVVGFFFLKMGNGQSPFLASHP